MNRTYVPLALAALTLAASGIFTGCGSGKPEAKRPVRWQISGPVAETPKPPALPDSSAEFGEPVWDGRGCYFGPAPKETTEEIFQRLAKMREETIRRLVPEPAPEEKFQESDRHGQPAAVANKFLNSLVKEKSAKSFRKTFEMEQNGQTAHFYLVETIDRWTNTTSHHLLKLSFVAGADSNGEMYLDVIQEIESSDPNYAKYAGLK